MEGEVSSAAEGGVALGKCSGFQDSSDDSQETAADDDREERPFNYTETELHHVMSFAPINKGLIAERQYPFVCYICDFTCKDMEELKKHKPTHRGQKLFACTLCNSTCKTSGDFKRHKMLHFNLKPYVCDRCPYSTAVSTNLRRHKMMHAGEKPYACDQCPYSTAVLTNLKKHKMIHAGVKPYACNVCNYSSTEASNLKKHLRIHSGQRSLVCGLCDFSCRTSKEFNKHSQQHPDVIQFCSDQRTYSSVKLDALKMQRDCDNEENGEEERSVGQTFKCSETEDTSSDVREKVCEMQETTDHNKSKGDVRHLRDSERTQQTRQRVKTILGDDIIKIEQKDGNVHNLPSKLVESERTPSGVQDNNVGSREALRHKCESNSKAPDKIKNEYTDTEISHMMTLFPVNKDMMADKKYPFVCYICDFTCKGFKQLKKHKLVHRGQKTFPCTLCNSTSKTSSDFKRHKMMHFNVKPYGCDQCPYSTAVSTNLKNHKKIHTGEKPYACTFCDYSCSEGGNLKKHLRIHSAEKPFACSLCDFSCRTAKELGRHERKHPKMQQPPGGYASVKLDTLRNKLIHAVEKSFRHESSDGLVKDMKMEEDLKQSFECTPNVEDAGSESQKTRARHQECGETKMQRLDGESGEHLFEDSLSSRVKDSCDTDDDDSNGCLEFSADRDGWSSMEADKTDDSQDIAENIRKYITKMKDGGKDAPNLTETELHHMMAFYPMNEDVMARMQFPFVCYVCDFTCKGKEEFKDHKLTHRGQREFPCTLCSSVSKTSGDFKRHKMLHFNLKPYVCDRCPYSTAFSPNLKKHKMIHSGVKPHVCDSCGYSCTELGNLKKHRRIHSDELSSGLPFTCNMCEFSCRTAKEFIAHSLEHSETMRHPCDRCGCTYATLDSLNNHKLIHASGARNGHNDDGEMTCKLDEESAERPFENKDNIQTTPGILADSTESREAAERAADAEFERQLIKMEEYSDDQLSTYAENEQNSSSAPDQMDDSRSKAEQIEDREFENQLMKMEDNSDDRPFTDNFADHSGCFQGPPVVHGPPVKNRWFNEDGDVPSTIQSKSEEAAMVNDDLIRKMIKMENNGEEPINYTETEVHHVMAFFPMNEDLMADMRYPFVCYICDFTCKDIQSFKNHKLVHRGQKLFPCTLCNSTCKKASDFKRHKMLHFNVKPFVCDQCPYSTAVSTNLRKHKMIHTGVKPYACSTCNYACSELGSLKKHQLIHSGEKPFLCSLCDFSCRSSSDLTRHKTTHFEIKQFSCDMCSYTCARLDTLRIHSLVHTDEKPFSCDSCSFVCKSLGILINHKRRHSGERPYGCEICPFTCVQLVSFRRHMQGHSEVRAFACDICNFSCKRRDNLKTHRLLHAAPGESVAAQKTVHRKTQKLKSKQSSVAPEVPVDSRD